MTYSKLGKDTKTDEWVNIFKTSRLLGLYIIGLQGMGKSGLIEELIVQDIKQEIGVCVLDPHGELVDHVIARLPDDKQDKVILLDLANYEHPFGLNLFECARPTDDGEIVQTLYQVLHVFEKAYGIVPTTPLMYDLLYNTVYTLIANPGSTMIDIRLLLTNDVCRRKLVQNVPNPDIQSYWAIWDDPKQTSPEKREEKRATILNKMNDFLHIPLRNIVGQSQSTIHLPTIMDKGDILLVKLSRRLEQPSNLIGSILVAQLLNAAYARPPQKRKQFHLYADEFQNFATPDFATLLEEARKFGIGTTIAHQNRGQLNSADSQLEANLKDRSRSVGNLVVFKINSKDATDLSGEFNITPQPAWEEVLEEERVQVLKEAWVEEIEPEKHQRVEEVVDDGVEEIKTPLIDPVEFLLTKGGHPNPTVMAFVNTYLRKMEETVKVGGQFNGKLISQEEVAKFLQRFKTFISEVIASGDPAKKITPELFAPTNNYPIHAYETGVAAVLGFPHLLEFFGRDNIGYYAPKVLLSLFASPDGRLHATDSEIQGLLDDYLRLLVVQERRNLESVATYTPIPGILPLRDMDYELFERGAWYREHPGKIDEYVKEYESNLFNSKNSFFFSSPIGMPTGAQEQGKIRHELKIAEAFFISLRAFLKTLVAEPILVPSGQYQQRKRTQVHYLTTPRKTIQHPPVTITHPRKTIMHPQRTYADVQAEIASELVNLPQYTAKVKLSDGSGTTIEHTIRTEKPGTGLSGQALQERVERIREQNMKKGYLRKRAEVEAEIRDRQIQCGQQGGPLTHPQSPHHPPSPPATRKVRFCSSCGFSNRQGANFCNQCGTKL
jgi:hypothetical protein